MNITNQKNTEARERGTKEPACLDYRNNTTHPQKKKHNLNTYSQNMEMKRTLERHSFAFSVQKMAMQKTGF